MARHIIFDTETTDLIHNSLQPLHKQPRVIEFFSLTLDDERDWDEVEMLHHYINPRIRIPPEVTRITGLDNEKLKDAPDFMVVADSIRSVFEQADVAVAHNLSYDRGVLEFESNRLGGQPILLPKRQVCTVESTEHLKGYRLNLTALHTELFGEGFEKAHSAEHDVRATARCYIELVKRGEI